MMNENPKSYLVFVVVILIAVLAYGVLIMPDKRSTGDKISDAWHAWRQGDEHPGRQLEDRTPGQKLGDSVKDSGDRDLGNAIKDNTKPSTP